MDRRQFFRTSAAAVAAGSLARRASAADPRPNVIFILTDDMGWADAHRFGHPYLQTPNLDRLASESTWFRQFYVANPVCSPSRTAFMTGHFPARHRVHQHFATDAQNAERGMPNWLDPEVTTICDVLKGAGYATGHFGKWHLSGPSPAAPLPGEYGLDDARLVNANAAASWPKEVTSDPYFRAKSTGLIVDETIRFMAAHPDQPCYTNLWTLVPHATLAPTPEELAVYERLEVHAEDFPSYMREYVAAAPDMTAQMRVYCAAMTGLDQAIGRLLNWLDDTGRADNTLIVFSSDNGPEDYHVKNASNAGIGFPGDFRGRKRSLYEGGLRTPLLVRWPGKVAAGAQNDEAVLTAVDFLPTICAVTGTAMPDIKPDGEDVSDIIGGAQRARTRPICWEWRGGVAGNQTYRPPRLAVRDGRWKLFIDPDGSAVELYDIPADPEERRNVAAQQPDVVAKLSRLALTFKGELSNWPAAPASAARAPSRG